MVAASGIRAGMLDNGSSVPFYEYRRPDGTILEVMQKMTDPPLTEDPETGVPLQRIFHPIAVHFKGKGFYNTDYGTKKRARENAETKASEKKSDDKKSDAAASSSDSKAQAKSESPKTETKSSSPDASSSSSKASSKPKES
jgi:predicted nucleic acid-binding Zn ribbon protein